MASKEEYNDYGKALEELKNILKRKGAVTLFSKNLSGAKTRDSSYLEANLRDLLNIAND